MGLSSTKEVAIVGMPRCGTTYLFRSVAGLPPGAGTPKGKDYRKMAFLKSHSLAPPDSFGDPHAEDLKKHVEAGGKVIWVFGDPVAAILSTVKNRLDTTHAKNCGFFGDLSKVNLICEDVFNYERMFDSWMFQAHDYPVLGIRYEMLWAGKMKKRIEQFLGREIEWNEWRPRRTLVRLLDVGTVERVEETYSRLVRKARESADVVEFSKGKWPPREGRI